MRNFVILFLAILLIGGIAYIIFPHTMPGDMTSPAGYDSGERKAVYLARAGAMKMLAELANDANSYDSLNEDWNRDKDNPKELKLGKDPVFYGASDGTGNLNLNSPFLRKEHLVRLGMDIALALSIIDYKDKKGEKGFEFPEELFLVKGMNYAIYSKIKPYVTIYAVAHSKVNINTANKAVLQVLIEDDELVLDVLKYRKGPDGEEGTSDDGIFKGEEDFRKFQGLDPASFSVRSSLFRIWAWSSFSEDNQARRTIDAVITRSGKIHYWKEY